MNATAGSVFDRLYFIPTRKARRIPNITNNIKPITLKPRRIPVPLNKVNFTYNRVPTVTASSPTKRRHTQSPNGTPKVTMQKKPATRRRSLGTARDSKTVKLGKPREVPTKETQEELRERLALWKLKKAEEKQAKSKKRVLPPKGSVAKRRRTYSCEGTPKLEKSKSLAARKRSLEVQPKVNTNTNRRTQNAEEKSKSREDMKLKLELWKKKKAEEKEASNKMKKAEFRVCGRFKPESLPLSLETRVKATQAKNTQTQRKPLSEKNFILANKTNVSKKIDTDSLPNKCKTTSVNVRKLPPKSTVQKVDTKENVPQKSNAVTRFRSIGPPTGGLNQRSVAQKTTTATRRRNTCISGNEQCKELMKNFSIVKTSMQPDNKMNTRRQTFIAESKLAVTKKTRNEVSQSGRTLNKSTLPPRGISAAKPNNTAVGSRAPLKRPANLLNSNNIQPISKRRKTTLPARKSERVSSSAPGMGNLTSKLRAPMKKSASGFVPIKKVTISQKTQIKNMSTRLSSQSSRSSGGSQRSSITAGHGFPHVSMSSISSDVVFDAGALVSSTPFKPADLKVTSFEGSTTAHPQFKTPGKTPVRVKTPARTPQHLKPPTQEVSQGEKVGNLMACKGKHSVSSKHQCCHQDDGKVLPQVPGGLSTLDMSIQQLQLEKEELELSLLNTSRMMEIDSLNMSIPFTTDSPPRPTSRRRHGTLHVPAGDDDVFESSAIRYSITTPNQQKVGSLLAEEGLHVITPVRRSTRRSSWQTLKGQKAVVESLQNLNDDIRASSLYQQNEALEDMSF